MSPLDTFSLLGLRSRISFAAQSGHMAAAALRRHAVGLQQALARLSSTVSGAWQPHRVIPAEVAQLVSLRGGMTALPPDIVAAVDQAAAGEVRWQPLLGSAAATAYRGSIARQTSRWPWQHRWPYRRPPTHRLLTPAAPPRPLQTRTAKL
jgi:hypothetical protein